MPVGGPCSVVSKVRGRVSRTTYERENLGPKVCMLRVKEMWKASMWRYDRMNDLGRWFHFL